MFLYVRNNLFCTKLLYFMPDARGCRAQHARMPRARAAVCGTSVSFAVTIFKDILNHVYRSSILLDVRKPFCTKLLYTSCLMRADAAHGRGCRARCCLWNERFFSKIPYCNDAYRGSSVSLCEKLFCTKLLYFMPDARGCFLWNRRFFCSYNLEG